MELLQKFAAGEIQVDDRISETDKYYCEQHQKAYETAICSFKELGFFWADMKAAQRELLGEEKGPFYRNYLASRDGPSISQELIERHIASLHTDFIANLVRHFNSTYQVTVDSTEIIDALLPKKPKDSWQHNYEELCKTYHAQMQTLTVQYQDVVDQIILRLDGRSFSEQAFYELTDKCHDAAWNSYDQNPKFERRKETICFIGYFCRFRGWPYDGWELDDGMQNILRGVAHFETDSYHILPVGFSNLFGYHDIKEPIVEFPTCEKVKLMKLFKNNRVDLKFYSPEYAEQFVGKYLGAVG